MLLWLKPILSEIVLFFGSCSILLLDVFQRYQRYLVFIFMGILAFCILLTGYFSVEGTFYHDMFYISEFTQMIKLILLVILLFYIFGNSNFMEKYPLNSSEYYVMIGFMMLGMWLMISANHFISLYIGMEIQSLSAYTLAAMQRKSVFSSEAGIKYFILGSVASVIYLFGTSYIYGSAGTLYFHQLTIPQDSLTTYGLGLVFILSSFFFKVGMFPFHQWIPDVYQGAPTPSTGLLATLSKIGAFAVVLRLISGPFHSSFYSGNWDGLWMVASVGSMMIGAVVPLSQIYLKRLLGYSAIGHVGFMLMGLLGLTSQGFSVIITYIVVYSLSLMAVFITFMSLKETDIFTEEHNDISLNKLQGLIHIRPKHAILLSVCFLSMAGLPPLIGFFPKLLILNYVIYQNYFSILIIGILYMVISLVYYLKLIKLMFMDTTEKVLISMKVKHHLWKVFWPVIFIHLLGGYLPLLKIFHQDYIIPAVNSLFVKNHEKDNL